MGARRGRVFLYAALGVAFVISAAIAWNSYTIRSHARWFARAHRYKSEVLAQRTVNGQLQHSEWDGWGGAPVGDWEGFILFSILDTLSEEPAVVHPANSTEYHAMSMKFAAWKVIGTLSPER